MATVPNPDANTHCWPCLGQLRSIDWMWIALAILVPVAGLLLEVDESGRVAPIGIAGYEFPAVCGSRVWLGIDCPLCGITRSIIHATHGELRASWDSHRLGWLVGFIIVAQLPCRIAGACLLRLGSPGWARAEAWCWGTLGVLLVINRLLDVFN